MRQAVALLAVALLWLAAPSPARAALTEADLAEVDLAPPPGAALPTWLTFRDESGASLTLAEALAGRPAVLVFADYTCTVACGTTLGIAAAMLDGTGLRPDGYAFIVIGLDPRDGPAEAAAMKAAHLGSGAPPAAAARLLSGGAATLRQAEKALGYRARYDAEHDQYAHPLGLLVVAPDGRVSRILPALSVEPGTLRLALVEASAGRTGNLGDRLRLLCYAFDAARGIYTPIVQRFLALGSAVTILLLGAWLLLMLRRERRA
jgi:protein SCO1/2